MHVEVCHSAVMSLFHLSLFFHKNLHMHISLVLRCHITELILTVKSSDICFVDCVIVHRITGNSCMAGCETH